MGIQMFKFMALLIAACLGELTPSNAVQDQIRDLQSGARGFIENFVITFTVPDNSVNVVEVNLRLDIFVSSGDLTSFAINIFDTDFGKFMEETLVATQDGVPVPFQSRFGGDGSSISSSGFVTSGVNLVDVIRRNERTALVFNFLVEDMICDDGNRVGVMTTWVASLTTIETSNIEYIYILSLEDFDEVPEISSRPRSSDRTINVVNNTLQVNIPYSSGRLDFGDETPTKAILAWEGFEGEFGDCPSVGDTLSFVYLLVAVPLFLCLFLAGAAVLQRYTDSRRGRYGREATGSLRYFPGGRDIVLRPREERTRDVVVQAIPEAEDETNRQFDDIVPVTTIRVDLDDQRPASQRQTAAL